MKNIIIFFLIILFVSNLKSQSQWDISSIPFSGYNFKYVNNVSFINADIGYVITYSYTGGFYKPLHIFKTNDKGLGWTYIGNLGENIGSVFEPYINFVDQNTGFVATIASNNKITVYKTTNEGLNWSSNNLTITQGSSAFPRVKLKFVSKYIGYISTLYSIYKTINCGQNWFEILPWNNEDPFQIRDIEISPSNQNTIYAVGGWYDQDLYFRVPKIRKTTDGGASWQMLVNYSTSVYGINDVSIVTESNNDILKKFLLTTL